MQEMQGDFVAPFVRRLPPCHGQLNRPAVISSLGPTVTLANNLLVAWLTCPTLSTMIEGARGVLQSAAAHVLPTKQPNSDTDSHKEAVLSRQRTNFAVISASVIVDCTLWRRCGDLIIHRRALLSEGLVHCLPVVHAAIVPELWQ